MAPAAVIVGDPHFGARPPLALPPAPGLWRDRGRHRHPGRHQARLLRLRRPRARAAPGPRARGARGGGPGAREAPQRGQIVGQGRSGERNGRERGQRRQGRGHAAHHPPAAQPHGGTALVLERALTDVATLIDAADGPLDEGVVKAIAWGALAALGAAHAARVAHRDVKPGNLLLTDDGRVLLGDWGQAAEVGGGGGGGGDPALAPPGAPGGTRWYRPPEALAGDPTVGPGADAWGVGASIAHALARAPAAAGATDLDQLARLGPLLGVDYGGTGGAGMRTPWGGGGGGTPPGTPRGGRAGARPPRRAGAAALAAALPDASPAARDLLAALLAPDPETRPGAEEALRHAWFFEAPRRAGASALAAAAATAAAAAAAAAGAARS